MSYKTYVIECDYIYTTGIVLSALEDMEETHEASYIDGNMVCVDTFATFEELYKVLVVTLDLTIGISEINRDNFDESMLCYNPSTKNRVRDFIEMTEISTDINYFLDLIIDRGGVNHLTLKEYQRLEELSK